ncbi:VanZ family protein [Agrococcus sp. SL85]|uniref:VanZ family protein n=1 Tax=Agrococcus sp. SL85 TaxID=2995141 RepID=UPI00226C87A8|nr:VanZ family protein [Agrococcus sp. SL85]WAC66830.1 VanZ family protein [Agrococcus sp. SL85]
MSRRAPSVGRRRPWAALLVLALAVQLVVLYLPSPPSTGAGVPHLDKLVHAAVFAAPALAAVLAGIRPRFVLLVLGAHALGSEVLQHLVLPERSGDPWDAVADLAGLVLGLWAGVRAAGAGGRAGREGRMR